MQASSGRTVLISGAGIAGPTLAHWLVRYGFRPTLLEAAPSLRDGGYMIDFWGVGYDVAEKMGLIPKLKREGYDITEIRIMDAVGRHVGGFDASVFRSATGDRFFSILRGDLAREIFRTIASDVEVIFGDGITAIEQDAGTAHVTFRSGVARSFDLVIGADGLHSSVRKLFGHEREFDKYLGYYTASFEVADYPNRTENAYVSYGVPGRQVARYALRSNRTAFFFIFATPSRLMIPHHDVPAQKAVLRATFHEDGWECGEILDALDSSHDIYFDAVSQIRMGRWSHGRVALIGDAAFCPSLLAGQGAAFAMAAAYLLSGELRRANGDHTAAFANYERTFRPFIESKQTAAERFGGWFAPKTQIGLWVRNATSRMISLPLIGPWLAGRAFGDRFALPDYNA
ncbi:MAG: FAD-binding domain [Rhizobiales bacterium]|nr:FAD-binding domain [Hyphomicrobiales bacterium]